MAQLTVHAGRRTTTIFAEIGRVAIAAARVDQEFALLRSVVQAADIALDGRHVAMHTVWTLIGQDAVTPADDLVAALESPDPGTAPAALVGRDVESQSWCAAHPRTGGLSPAPLVDRASSAATLSTRTTADKRCPVRIEFSE